MKNLSIKHHYLPEFYLKNFTQNNQFYIYLPKEKRFKKNGKLFTPSSHFFAPHGNTMTIDGITDDLLETSSYRKLDNLIAPIFEKIKSSNEPKYGLSDKEIVLVDYFFSHLFWRNPINDEFLKRQVAAKPIESFGIKIVDDKGSRVSNSYAQEAFRRNSDSYKFIKYWLPLSMFENKFKDDKNLHLLHSPVYLPCVLGDNPVIVKGGLGLNTYLEEIIVPVTGNIFFCRTKTIDNNFSATVKMLIDIMQVRQANEFVCCTNMVYLESILKIFDEKIKDDQTLLNLIFIGLDKERIFTEANQPIPGHWK